MIFVASIAIILIISMAVGEDKVRTNITFPKELKSELEEIAKKDGRSFNNLVIKVLSDFVESQEK